MNERCKTLISYQGARKMKVRCTGREGFQEKLMSCFTFLWEINTCRIGKV